MSAIDQFIEEMGLISQESGGARIPGRLLGLLLVEGEAMSLQQISERLAVSRASVSTNARLLARRGILRLTTRAGDRQDYYELSVFPYFDMLGEIAGQFERHGRTIRESGLSIREENRGAGERVAELASFYEKSAEILKGWALALREDQSFSKDR